MDLVLICLEYTDNYVCEASIKPMIYAIKLKLEFSILNQLMSMATAGLTEGCDQAGAANFERAFGGGNNNNNKPPLSSEAGIRRTDAVKNPRSEGEMWNPNEIYMTQHIEVIHEDASTKRNKLGDNLNPSGPTAPTPPRRSNLLAGELKVKSLMGTTHVQGYKVPVRRTPTRLEGPRAISPSESQKEVWHSMELSGLMDEKIER